MMKCHVQNRIGRESNPKTAFVVRFWTARSQMVESTNRILARVNADRWRGFPAGTLFVESIRCEVGRKCPPTIARGEIIIRFASTLLADAVGLDATALYGSIDFGAKFGP